MSSRILFLSAALLSLAVAGLAHAGQGADATAWQSLLVNASRAASAGDFANSEQLYLKAIKEAEQFPPGDARPGVTFNYLGLLYKEQKKYGEAEKAFEKALGILEKAYGPDSLDVGNVNLNIASVLLTGGHWDSALPYIQKSRAVFEKVLGPDSLKTASTLCMTGDVYRNLKKINEAEAPLKQCADIREAAGGLENPELADALFGLGLVYQSEGRYALADQRLRLAEKIREITLGVTSPEFADALEAHAAVLKVMGRDQEAARDQVMASAIRRMAKKTQ